MSNDKIENLDRQEFMRRTGIYVTPLYFNGIKNSFATSGLAIDEFIEDRIDPNRDFDIAEIKLTGVLKCYYDDASLTNLGGDKEPEDRTTMEIIEDLAVRNYELEVLKDKRSEAISKLMDMHGDILGLYNLVNTEYKNEISQNQDLVIKINSIIGKYDKNRLEFAKICELDMRNKIITPNLYFESEWLDGGQANE